ncbi:MAG: glycoside hydrolase family 5 [Flavobacteriaceae bacterium]|nr:MAG: glycoside hydrolase family 5 [Flavobacteriaceae bacterium]
MNTFLQTSGTQIIDTSNQQIHLRGFAFGNQVWETNDVPINHHSEIDYERLKNMGANVVRFYMNYKAFESDTPPYKNKKEGWDWLNENIAWAKKHGIYHILNLHLPHGRFLSLGDGNAIWDESIYQDRIASFWKKIAEKYKNEPQIAGYGLLNEPSPTASISQWQNFAQRLTDEIRAIDKNHILFIERAIKIKEALEEDHNLNFPIVKDNNIAYEFHMFQPYAYTHQLLEWAGIGDVGSYPDAAVSQYTNELDGADNSDNTAYKRDKTYLKVVLERFVAWGNKNQVPMYMGEFGTCIPTFKDNKGGLNWVKDVLEIANENNLNYTYHAYHEDSYGVYSMAERLPNAESANEELINLFMVFLG